MFDIIGDVHGCSVELVNLLRKLGYDGLHHPLGRKVVFVGDLCDRGPKNLAVLSIVKRMISRGNALMVLGNHDNKLMRWLRGNKVTISHGLQKTVDEFTKVDSEEFNRTLHDFLAAQPISLTLDSGKLHVVHAAAPRKYQVEGLTGKKKKAKKAFALYGVTTGKKTPEGFPERVDWAQNYDGEAIVVHGHVAQREATRVNNVFNVDTACVFGNKLTALRYPELEFVSVKAERVYHFDPRLSPEE